MCHVILIIAQIAAWSVLCKNDLVVHICSKFLNFIIPTYNKQFVEIIIIIINCSIWLNLDHVINQILNYLD